MTTNIAAGGRTFAGGGPRRPRWRPRPQALEARGDRAQRRRRLHVDGGKRDFAAKHGLTLTILAMKNGALAHKALLSGELDSIEFEPGRGDPGRLARRRPEDRRLRLAGRAARADGAAGHRQDRRPQRQDGGGRLARLAAQPAVQGHAGKGSRAGERGEGRQSRRRPRPLQGGGGRAWRTPASWRPSSWRWRRKISACWCAGATCCRITCGCA